MTLKKNVLASVFVFILCLTVSSFAFTNFAYAETSGDYVYTINGDSTATITDYTGTDEVVTFPESLDGHTVKSICASVAGGMGTPTMTSVIIPGSIKEISCSSFYQTTSLTSITLNEGLVTIGSGAFEKTRLTSVTIPDSVRTISGGAFFSTTLTSVDLGNGVETIDGGAFQNTGLTSIIIPDSVTTLVPGAFGGTPLASAVIGSGLKTISAGMFSSNPTLTNVTLKEGLVTIGGGAFSGTGLTSITIPDSVTTLEGGAFNGTPLVSAIIGSGITTLPDGIFYNISTLTNVTLKEGLVTIGSGAFEKTRLTSVTIPNSVRTISNQAFSGISTLNNVTLKEGLVTIGGGAFSSTGLTSITIPDSVTTLVSGAFGGTPLVSAVIGNGIATIPSGIFSGISTLTNVTLKEGLVTIGSGAFGGTGLTSITIPDSVRTISTGAFAGIGTLTSVNLGNGLENLGDGVFGGTGLTSIKIPDSVITLGQAAFPTTITSVDIGGGIKTIINGAIPTNNLNSLILHEGLEVIEAGAFYGSKITSIVIPNSVTTISNGAFQHIPTLTSVDLGNGVKTIGRGTFGYTALTSINIPDSVTAIGDGAFYKVPLTSVILGSGLQNIPNALFADISTLTSVTLKEGLVNIGMSAFSNTRLTSITIPDSVTAIGDGAFSNVSTLINVDLGNGIKEISSGSFTNTGITNIFIPDSVVTLSNAFAGVNTLKEAYFTSNAPVTIGDSIFDGANPSFTLYYLSGKTGFDDAWNIYNTVMITDFYPASNITTKTATLKNFAILSEEFNSTSKGFEYGLNVSSENTKVEADSNDVVFSIKLTGLTCNTTYHYRAYASNQNDIIYGDDRTFTTDICPTIPEIIETRVDSKSSITILYTGNTKNFIVENITSGTNSGWKEETSHQFTGLTCNQNYSFKVKGKTLDNSETEYGEIVKVLLPCPVNNIGVETQASVTITTQEDFEEGLLNNLDSVTVSGDISIPRTDEFVFDSTWGIVGSGEGEFYNPKGVATDSFGNIYVSDSGNNRIQKFNSNKVFLKQWGILGNGENQFNNPLDIAIDSEDKVYVVDSGNNRIKKFTSDGVYIAQWGIVGSGEGEFYNPKGVAIDSSNNIYVSDSGNNRIQKFNSEGVFIKQFNGSNPINNFTHSKFISIPSSWDWATGTPLTTPIMSAGSGVIDEYIYIVGGTNNWNDDIAPLWIYDPSNNTWDETKNSMSTVRVTPLTVAVDKKLYVIGGKNEEGNGLSSVEMYDTEGDGTWNTSLNSMTKLRIGPAGDYYDGKIYVVGGSKESCSSTSEVSMEVYDVINNTWETKSNAPINKMTGATGKIIDGILYIVGGQMGCNKNFSDILISYNTITDTWNINLAKMPSARAGGASFVSNGKFYYLGGTTDTGWNTQNDIFEYNPITNTWATYGGALIEPNHRPVVEIVNNILYVIGGRDYNWDTLNTNYNINVSDFGKLSELPKVITGLTWAQNTLPSENSSIEILYSTDGGENYTSLGSNPGTYPINSTTNTINYRIIYNSDSSSGNKYLQSLSLDYTMGGESYNYDDPEISNLYFDLTSKNLLDRPSGLIIDKDNFIYVADTGSYSIKKFTQDGVFISKIDCKDSNLEQLNPLDIAIDLNNNLHVTNIQNNIEILDQDGNLISNYKKEQSEIGDFNQPYAISINSNENINNIYTVDSNNNRIIKFISQKESSTINGDFTSSVINASKKVKWTTLTTDQTLPANTSIKYYSRTGSIAIPDNTWSEWVEIVGGIIPSPDNQYFQIKAIMSGNSGTPIVHSITINCEGEITPVIVRKKNSRIIGSSANFVKQFETQQNIKPSKKENVITKVETKTPTIITTTVKTLNIKRLLKLNITGDDVKELQSWLNDHGYPISLTGAGSKGYETTKFGPLTKKAVILFQKANGLIPDGIVGSKTLEKMK